MPDPMAIPQRTRRPLWPLFQRALALSGARWLLLLEAVFWLGGARLALVLVPFRDLAARFGQVHTPQEAATLEPRCYREQELSAAREIGWAVTRAARYVPFRAVCLPQAIAAKAMLARRGIPSVMHFGVAKNVDKPMDAHAWLNVGEVEVTGFPVQPGFVEVANFQ